MTETRKEIQEQPNEPDFPGRRIFRASHLLATATVAAMVLHSSALGNQDYEREDVAASLYAMAFSAPYDGLSFYPAGAGDLGRGGAIGRPNHVPQPQSAPAKRVVALTMLDADFAADPAFPDIGREGYGLTGPKSRAEAEAEREIACLALNIYHEARGETLDGKIAVGHVVMNRIADRRFPNTVCDVIRQGGEQVRYRCQFSWWCDGRSDRPGHRKSWTETKALARDVYWGYSKDPTEGALWYHADYVSPYWRQAFQQGPTIGRHIFYRDKPTKGRGKPTQVASSR